MAVFLVDPYSAGCACSREKCSNDCSFYRKYKPKLKPITHFDEIKAMSVEEMAEFMKSSGAGCPDGCFVGDYGCKDCKGCWLDWLKQEVSE